MTKEEAWELAVKSFDLSTEATEEFYRLQGASATFPQNSEVRKVLTRELETRLAQIKQASSDFQEAMRILGPDKE